MAIVRRINFIDFKEVIVDYPEPDSEFGNLISENIVVPRNVLSPQDGYISKVNLNNYNIYGQTGAITSTGARINTIGINQNRQKDIDLDLIPDGIDVDADGDDVFETTISDFGSVIKKSFLLGKIQITDSADDSGKMTLNQFYEEVYQNAFFRFYEDSVELDGWVILSEAKHSYFYEDCITEINGKSYSGRIPVSINYYDLDDIYLRQNTNGSINFVSGEGEDPLYIISQQNLIEGQFTMFSRFIQNAVFGNYDISFGPPLSKFKARLPYTLMDSISLKNYFENAGIVNPSLNSPILLPGEKSIRAELMPINLHGASRFDILKEYQTAESINTSDVSRKALWTNTFTDQSLKEYLDNWYNSIPDIIQFSDGKKNRYGTPRFVIRKGFSFSNRKFYGDCIPLTDEDIDDEISNFNITSSKKRVRISDVLSNRVKLDGTNYIEGVITAHYIFPLKSLNTKDIDNLHYSILQGGGFYNATQYFINNFFPDPYTFARELRNVVFIQDDSAGMQLLGTDFYSKEGLTFAGLPDKMPFQGVQEIPLPGGPLTVDISGYQKRFQKVREEIIATYESTDTTFGNRGVPISFPRSTTQYKNVDTGDRVEIGNTRSGVNKLNFRGGLNASSYWETDTAYPGIQRYHFKVGDSIQVYNMRVIDRPYTARTCKLINNEYRIIPNKVNDIYKFFEESGLIRDVSLSDLRFDGFKYENGKIKSDLSGIDVVNYDKWKSYDYLDEDSPHRNENCLIRVRDVAFAIPSDPYDRRFSPPQYGSKSKLVDNDMGPSLNESFKDSSGKDYFGMKFAPGKRFLIRDVSDRDYSDSSLSNNLDSFHKKGYVYISYGTEMGEEFLKIPGRPIEFKDASEKINSAYLDWYQKNKKEISLSPKDKEISYKWPLDILGIQVRSMISDASVVGGDFYEIWPRSYMDFGIKKYFIDTKTGGGGGIDGVDKNTGRRVQTGDVGTTSIPIGTPGVVSSGGGSSGTGTPGSGTTGGDRPGSGSGGGVGRKDEATCFPNYAKVLTPRGEVSISQLMVGDIVITFDETGKLHKRKILKTYVHDNDQKTDVYRYYMSDGKVVDITENHPVLTKNGFVHIGNLQLGSGIIDVDGNEIFIISKMFLFNDVVYNIEVEEHNAYIAFGIRVHNLTKKVGDRMRDIVSEEDPSLGRP